MTLRSVLLIAALAAAAGASPVRAQDRSIYPGDRIRVTEATRWIGMVQGVSPDTLDVVPDGHTVARPVALSSVRRVEISVGKGGHGRGFLIGGVAGAGVAAGAAAVISELHTCEGQPNPIGFTAYCETVGPVAIIASGLFGFAAGGTVGAIFGGGEKWVRAAAPVRVGSIRLRLRLVPLDSSTPRELLAEGAR